MILIILLAAAIVPGGGARAAGPVDHVDPRIGVLSENSIVGPCLPNASIHPSPQTPDIYEDWRYKPGNDGYSPNSPIIGFAQLHAEGTGGTASYGQILLSPQTGAIETDPDLHASEKSDEIARADYYAVTLDRYGVRCEVVPERHSALYRFTFPDGVEPALVLNVGRKIKGRSLTSGSIDIDPGAGEVVGSGRYVGNWSGVAFDLHCCVRVDAPLSRFGTFSEDTTFAGRMTAVRSDPDPTDRFGAYLVFAGDAPRVIEVRVAISFRSVSRAREWLAVETSEKSLEELRTAASDAWDDRLGRIAIDGATDDQKRIFYTALMRCFIQPRDRTADVVDLDDDAVFWDDHYTMWDTYRTVWPLLCLISPDVVSGSLEGFSTTFARSGRVGTASVGTRMVPSDHQGGTEVDNIIADAFVKGMDGSWPDLLAIVRHDHQHVRPRSYLEDGYVAHPSSSVSASATLALSLNDYGAYRLECALGSMGEAEELRMRSRSWRLLWDAQSSSEGFSGFVRPRDDAGGFRGGPDDLTGFYEETSWTYSFFVPHDVHALIDLCGGAERFNARLVHGFDTERLDHDNQPAFLAPWLHVYAGRPDLCSARVRDLIAAYTTTRYPGQEDAGAHAARFVFAALGFYPNAGQPIYLLHGPLYPRAEIRLGNGRVLVIEGEDAGPSAPYVQSASLDGVTLDRAWITHDELINGGRLVFHMGESASGWGRGWRPPDGYQLAPCAPTPTFRDLVTVYPVPAARDVRFRFDGVEPDAGVILRVYDVAGRLVRTVVDRRTVTPGLEVVWDGRSGSGSRLASGVYYYSVRSGLARERGRMLFQRP